MAETRIKISADVGQALPAFQQLADKYENLVKQGKEFVKAADPSIAASAATAKAMGQFDAVAKRIIAKNAEIAKNFGLTGKQAGEASAKELTAAFERTARDVGNRFGAAAEAAFRAQRPRWEAIGVSTGKAVSDGVDKSVKFDFTKVQSGLDKLVKVGLAAGAAIAGAFTALAVTSVKVGADFQAQMTSVGIVSGASADGLAKLTAQARELGRVLPVSAAEAASAQMVLAQAGKSTNDILALTPAVTQLAISQNYNLASSAEMLASTMTVFNIAMEDAGDVTDIFNNAANNSQLTMSDLQEVLQKVGPVAKVSGVSLLQLSSAAAALADSNIKGAMAGTALRGILSRLVDPPKEAADALQKLGVVVTDATGKIRPLEDIFKDLNAAGITAADSVRIFGVEALSAGSVLAAQSGNLNKYEQALSKTGTTAENVAKQMEDPTTRFKALQSAIADINIEIFDQLKGRLIDTTLNFTDLTNVIGEWIKQNNLAGGSLDAFLNGLGVSKISVEGLKTALANINVTEVFEQFKEAGRIFANFGSALTAIPWTLLISNVDKLFYLWSSGRVISFGADTLVFVKSLTALTALAPKLAGVTLGVAALGTAIVGAAAATTFTIAKLVVAYQKLQSIQAENSTFIPLDAQAYTAAVNGSAEALATLPPHLQALITKNRELNKEQTTQLSVMTMLSDKMKANATETSKQVSANEQLKTTIADIVGEYNAMKDKLSKQAIELNISTKELDKTLSTQMTELVKNAGTALEQKGFGALATPAIIAGLKAQGVKWGDAVSEGLQLEKLKSNLKGLQELDLTPKIGDVWTELVNGTQGAIDDIAKSANNPMLKRSFVDAFRDMGKKSGNALFSELANAMDKIDARAKKKEAEQKALSRYSAAQEDIAAGRAQVMGTEYIDVDGKRREQMIVWLKDLKEKVKVLVPDINAEASKLGEIVQDEADKGKFEKLIGDPQAAIDKVQAALDQLVEKVSASGTDIAGGISGALAQNTPQIAAQGAKDAAAYTKAWNANIKLKTGVSDVGTAATNTIAENGGIL